MLARPNSRSVVPSRATLRALRRLALAGSTAGAIGSIFTVAAISYEVNRRVRVAEHLVDQKRNLEATCPNYNAFGRGTAVDRMMEAAEAGEFAGLESMRKGEPFVGGQARSIHTRVPNPAAGTHTSSQQIRTIASTQEIPDPPLPGVNPLNPDWAEPSSGGNTQPTTARTRHAKFGRQRKPKTYGTFEFRTAGADREHRLIEALDLWARNKPIEASERLWGFQHNGSKTIPQSAKDLCLDLFDANMKEGNIFIAVKNFNWLADNAEVTQDLWEALISGFANLKSYETLATTYLRFSGQFTLSPSLRTTVIRALTDSYRLQEAQKFVNDHITAPGGHILCTLYLSQLWKKSHSADIVETEFEDIITAFREHGIPLEEGLFLPLMRAYVESGFHEKAYSLIEAMEKTHGINITSASIGLVAYSKALKSDWQGVEKIFQEIYDLGLDQDSPVPLDRNFDRIFLEYYLAHTGQEIRDFVFRAIERYGIKIENVLFRHVIMAFIQKGTPAMVEELITVAEERSWRTNITKEAFLRVLQEHRLSCETSDVGLWRMLRASQDKRGRASGSQRLLGFDKNSFPYDDAFKLPGTDETTTWWRKANHIPEASKKLDNFVALFKRMLHSVQTGHVGEAVSLFQGAKAAGKVMKQPHIELATVASIVHQGSIEEAKAIIEDARNGFEGPEKKRMENFFRQMLKASSKERLLKVAVLHYYKILDRQSCPIKHHFASSACAVLVKSGKPKAALRLFRAINKRKVECNTPFDSVAVTIIARAAAHTGNLKALRWAIITALHRPSAISRSLVAEVYSLLAMLKHKAVSPDLVEDFKLQLDDLNYMVTVLERKEAIDNKPFKNQVFMPFRGDKPGEGQGSGKLTWTAGMWSDMLDVRMQPGRKNLMGSVLNWSEREEFESLFKKKRAKKGASEKGERIVEEEGGEGEEEDDD